MEPISLACEVMHGTLMINSESVMNLKMKSPGTMRLITRPLPRGITEPLYILLAVIMATGHIMQYMFSGGLESQAKMHEQDLQLRQKRKDSWTEHG